MQPELCVIFNPAAGRQRAARRLQALRRGWGDHVTFWPTEEPGHAIELARRAALDGFRIVAAAGGDGTVHEVANGLLRAGRPDIAFAVLPIGSANDYHHSLEHDLGLGPHKPSAAVDVGLVRAPGGRSAFFVCCLGLGFNGFVTLESRRIRRLQGMALYGLATLRALWYHYRCPVMEIAVDDQPAWRSPTLMLSVLIGRREGGFVMAPDARVDDGWLDYVHSGALSRCEVLRFLPRLALFGPPHDHPKVRQGRARRLAVRSETPLAVHIDGEFFCQPDDDVRQLDIEILPGALTVRVL